MKMYRNDIVVAQWLNEVNTGENSGLWFYRDEIDYCQRKYEKAFVAAGRFGGPTNWDPTEFIDYIRRSIPAEKRIILNDEWIKNWPPLWVLIQELQCLDLSAFAPYENEFEWPGLDVTGGPVYDQWVAGSHKVDAYNEAVAEICQLNAVLMAASRHC